jgi:hypothetical protein
MATKAKTPYQTMVRAVVSKVMKKMKKDHPNMKQTEIMSKAWKAKEVLEARKKYDEWKAKHAKGAAEKKKVTKKPATKKKKPVKKTTKKVAKKK